MGQANPHQNVELLKAYGLGKVEGPAAETIALHLETCGDCQRVVNQVTKDATGRSPVLDAEPVSAALAGSPDYEVIREISRGGMGVVYLARNRRMDRLEGLKVVKQALLARAGALERFEREMRSAARLNHPNIVTAYSSPPLEGLLAFAMEYVDGIDLHQLVKARGPLPVSNACYYVNQAARGLQHAFEREMVHRDIKPNNLMLLIDGKKQVIKILDFGLAKATSENPIDGGLTREGQMLGTPHYMAPEQSIDAAKADIRADIYSLGCTLYYLLTGHPPFQDKESLYEILHAHQRLEVPSLNELRSDVPAELVAIVAKMMAKEPAQRYQQPAEVAQTLAPYFKQGVKPIPTGNNRFAAPPPAQTTAETASSKAVEATRQPTPVPASAGPAPADGGGPPPARANDASTGAFDVANRIQSMLELDLDSGSPATTGRPVRGRQRPAQTRSMSPKIWVGIVSAIVLLGGVGLWASGVFSPKVKTRQGMLDTEADESDMKIDKTVVTAARGPVRPAQRMDNEDQPRDQGTKILEVANKGKDVPKLPDGAGPRDVEAPGDFTTTSSGLSYRVLRHSNGRKPAADDRVLADYKGWLDDGSQFDNSYERGEPTELDLNKVITGWKEGLQLVGIGGMVELEVPPSLAYGTQSRPGIPANSTLHFIIELRSIKDLPSTALDGRAEPFFNGNDLTGWTGLPGYWQVRDGAIVGAPAKGVKKHTFLCSQRSYKDFEIKFQVRRKGGIGNTGVQFRSKIIDLQKYTVVGPQAEIDSADSKFPPGSALNEPDAKPGYASNRDVVNDIWVNDDFNRMHLRCLGKHVTVKLSGITILDVEYPSIPDEGIIAWQLNGYKSPDEVTFKDIQFADLTRGDSPLEAAAPPTAGKDDGSRPHSDDQIMGRLKNAKAVYEAARDQYREGVNKHFDRREEAARKQGKKKLVDQIKAERTAFEQRGDLPQSAPAELKRKIASARSAMESAHAAAVRDYTKAKNDSESAAVEKELEQFKRDQDAAWVALFNGKDTRGWHASAVVAKANWQVVGGTLVGSGEVGLLFTDRSDYQNFRLRVEAMLTEGADSGVFFRAQDERLEFAYEAEIGSVPEGKTGSFVVFDRGVKGVAPAPQPVPAGRWSTMDVLAEDNRFTIWVDGTQTAQYEDKERRFSKGAIAIQQIGGPKAGVVNFRKIEIKELPSK